MSESDDRQDHHPLPPLLNVVIVGKKGVGKSSFIARAINGPGQLFVSPPADTVLCSDHIYVNCAAPLERQHDSSKLDQEDTANPGNNNNSSRRINDTVPTGLLRLVLWESPAAPELSSVAEVLAQSADAILLLADASAPLPSVESSVPLWMRQSTTEALPATLFVITKTDASPHVWAASRARVRERISAIAPIGEPKAPVTGKNNTSFNRQFQSTGSNGHIRHSHSDNNGHMSNNDNNAGKGSIHHSHSAENVYVTGHIGCIDQSTSALVMRETSAKLGVNVTETLEDLGRLLLQSSPALAHAAVSAARYHSGKHYTSLSFRNSVSKNEGRWWRFPLWQSSSNERRENKPVHAKNSHRNISEAAIAGVADVWPELTYGQFRETVKKRASSDQASVDRANAESGVKRDEDAEDVVQQLRKSRGANVTYCPRGCGAALSVKVAAPSSRVNNKSNRNTDRHTSTVSTSHLHRHLTQDCPKQLIECPLHCGQRLKRQLITMHTQESCPKRLVVCKVAGCGLLICADELEAHQNSFLSTAVYDWNVQDIKHFVAQQRRQIGVNGSLSNYIPETSGSVDAGANGSFIVGNGSLARDSYYLSALEELGKTWNGESFIEALRTRGSSLSTLLGSEFTQQLLIAIDILMGGSGSLLVESSTIESSTIESSTIESSTNHRSTKNAATAAEDSIDRNPDTVKSDMIASNRTNNAAQGANIRQAAQHMQQFHFRAPGTGMVAMGTAVVGPDRVAEAMQRQRRGGSQQKPFEIMRGYSAPSASDYVHREYPHPVPNSVRALPNLPARPLPPTPPANDNIETNNSRRGEQTDEQNLNGNNTDSQQHAFKSDESAINEPALPPPPLHVAAASVAAIDKGVAYPPKFARMLKAGLPMEVVHHAMRAQGVALMRGPNGHFECDGNDTTETSRLVHAGGSGSIGQFEHGDGEELQQSESDNNNNNIKYNNNNNNNNDKNNDQNIEHIGEVDLPPKFARMLKAGLPMAAVQHAMKAQGLHKEHISSEAAAAVDGKKDRASSIAAFNISSLRKSSTSSSSSSIPTAARQGAGGMVGLLNSFDRRTLKPVASRQSDDKIPIKKTENSPSLVDMLGSFNRSSLRHVSKKDKSDDVTAKQGKGAGKGPFGMSDALAQAIELRRKVIDGHNDAQDSSGDSDNDDGAESSTSSDWR